MTKMETIETANTTLHDFHLDFRSCKKPTDHLMMLEACGSMVQDAVLDLVEQNGLGVQILVVVQVLTPQNDSAATLN